MLIIIASLQEMLKKATFLKCKTMQQAKKCETAKKLWKVKVYLKLVRLVLRGWRLEKANSSMYLICIHLCYLFIVYYIYVDER